MLDSQKDSKAVFGLFDNQKALEVTIENLKAANFRSEDISVLMPTDEASKDFALEQETKAPEGATTGAAGGFVLGGALGWLAGIGSLAIPGVGPFIAAGPIMAAVAGAGIGGAVAGITGGLIGLGIPEYEAKRYEMNIKQGGMLLSVHTDDEERRDTAKVLLEDGGARDVSNTGDIVMAPPIGGVDIRSERSI